MDRWIDGLTYVWCRGSYVFGCLLLTFWLGDVVWAWILKVFMVRCHVVAGCLFHVVE